MNIFCINYSQESRELSCLYSVFWSFDSSLQVARKFVFIQMIKRFNANGCTFSTFTIYEFSLIELQNLCSLVSY